MNSSEFFFLQFCLQVAQLGCKGFALLFDDIEPEMCKQVRRDASSEQRWSGGRRLVVRALGSGDRVWGFESRLLQSGFICWLFLSFFLSFFFFLSLPTVCTHSLSHTHNVMLAHAFACLTTCYGGDKREESQKNPSSSICEAKMDLGAMYGKMGKIK